jgi:hypothetical protein
MSSTESKPFKRLVIAAHFHEDTSWLNHLSQHWPVLIMGPGGLEVNKGREAMAYLTYIVENYDNLPESMAFIHSHEESWHTAGSTPTHAHTHNQTNILLSIPCWELIPYASTTRRGEGKENSLKSLARIVQPTCYLLT